MTLPKRYNPQEVEPRLMARWQASGVYHFEPDGEDDVFSIDTPPATVSGNLHLGHVYSYSHPDFIARFWRMRGRSVYYPMGYDDNGLPTERLVERLLGITAQQVGRQAFTEKCLEVSEEAEQDYEHLWKRLGLSIDWRYTYRTIDKRSRRISQLSFIDLYRKGLAYHRSAPAIWCPECRTAIAQAELQDMERQSEFVELDFRLAGGPFDGQRLPVATTRPELLPACVAVFVHPSDPRYQNLAGQKVRVPLFDQEVPLLADLAADPEKGTGVVMCCTFGDTTDVSWWRTHGLPLVEAVGTDGRLTDAAGAFAGLPVTEARAQVKEALEARGLLLSRRPLEQTLRVHERCDTPVEYILTRQWFVRILDFKTELLAAGEQVAWHPAQMHARYQAWVENLGWDWCISRQRYYGVPFPLWYCKECGEVMLAAEEQLPVDPLSDQPTAACTCGSTEFTSEDDVFDTWATSSLSPQIVGRWLEDPQFYGRVFPFSLRPQAHEIIRTWAFYTILKSHFHFGTLPWRDALISGWGIAEEGAGKISKSRGGGPMPPLEMIERYSADAVRYWASSSAPGKDSIISEDKVQMGAKLVTKLWNVARFAGRFLEGYTPPAQPPDYTPADRWILARLQTLVRRATSLMQRYEYAAAKSEVESFFWTELADNYLEMAKQRLYENDGAPNAAARAALHQTLLATLKLLAPFLPYVTEEIYLGLFAGGADAPLVGSIHRSRWPEPDPALEDPQAEALGAVLLEAATAVRRYKSEHSLPLGSELDRLQLALGQFPQENEAREQLRCGLTQAADDLRSVSRALNVEVCDRLDPDMEQISAGSGLLIGIGKSIA